MLNEEEKKMYETIIKEIKGIKAELIALNDRLDGDVEEVDNRCPDLIEDPNYDVDAINDDIAIQDHFKEEE